MNRNDFLRIIRDSGQVDRQMVGEVKELLDLFPWFQSAHLLLLKGLHNAEDIKFDSQLKKSAVYIADREILYYLLFKQAAPPVETEPVEPSIAEHAHEEPDNLQVVIESGRSSEDIIQELETSPFVSGSVEEVAVDGLHVPVQEVSVSNESETDESASLILIMDDGEIHIEETVVYMDPSIPVSGHGELLELEENEIDLTRQEDNTPEITGAEIIPESKRLKQAELIDKFILANPRIEPSREKIVKPVEDISAPFVEERSGLVTETLANIYINQGYYSRAIDIYEKLSLKYPEKSSYFATQIEKIKALIK